MVAPAAQRYTLLAVQGGAHLMPAHVCPSARPPRSLPMKTFTLFGLLLLAMSIGCGQGTGPAPDVAATEVGNSGKPDQADDGVLSIGDPAPPISVAAWANGAPVETLKQGHVYVIEFWATWCGPCLSGMPHLSELQAKYADSVTFIGFTNESAGTVDQFLTSPWNIDPKRRWNEVVQYRLAVDKAGATSAAYMQAAGVGTIPHAFLVGREGRIEWTGHPMGIDEPLAKVVDGTWDREAEHAFQRLIVAADRAMNKALQSEEPDYKRRPQGHRLCPR